MFGRHFHGGHHGPHGRGPFGFHAHGGDHGHHRGGGRPGRFFDQGDLRFVILQLIADQPSHGYELIKAVETAAGGAYSPSPGVIYPTLTLLEELGYVTATDGGGGKKLYTIAPEGLAFLEANKAHVDNLKSRLAEVAARSTASAPQILRATHNLKTALRMKLTGAPLSAEQVGAIVKLLDDTVRTIEQI